MSEQLKDKIAVVTGGGRGIGRCISLKLAGEGAKIAIVDYSNGEETQSTVEELKALGAEARCYACDVSNSAQVKETADRILTDFGGVDILVNNAGITRDGVFMKMSDEDIDAVLSICLKGTMYFTRAFCRTMMRRPGSRIINIASVVGLHGNAGQANYSAAKAGIVGFTKTMAKELAGKRVNVNAIAPGFIRTRMTDVLSDKAKEAILNGIPMKEMGDPEDVAETALFLASPASRYITGEVIRVDGGMCI